MRDGDHDHGVFVAARRTANYTELAPMVLFARVGSLYFLLDDIGLVVRTAAKNACYSRERRSR